MPLTRWKIHILYASMSLILSCTLIPKDGKLALLSRNTFKAGTYHWIRRSLRCWWCYLVSTYVWLLQPHGRQPTRLLCPWYFPGRNTAVGCHFLLQGIFLTQGIEPASLVSPCLGRWFLYHWATWEAQYDACVCTSSTADLKELKGSALFKLNCRFQSLPEWTF